MRLKYIRVGSEMVTGCEFRSRVRKLASALCEAGIAYGMPAAILMRNSIAQLEISEALRLVGSYAVQINWHGTPEEVCYVLRDCRAGILFCHIDLLESVAPELQSAIKVIGVDPTESIVRAYGLGQRPTTSREYIEYEPWLQSFEEKVGENDGRALESVIYTSGTTGRPKGVKRLAAEPLQKHLTEEMRRQVFGVTAGSVVLIPAPLYHAAPNLLALRAIRVADALILQPRFDAHGFLSDIESHGITHAYAIVTIFRRLLAIDPEERKKYDLSSLRFVLHGGGPCPPSVKRRMIDWLGPIINEYYGSTETGPISFCSSEDWLRFPGTVGRPVIGVDLEIRKENDEFAAVGQPGEICVKNHAYSDFTYINLPGARQELDRGGKVATGDIGYLNAEGFLFICDRKRDLVISGGVNIYPAEIEAVIQEIAGVRDCVVFGIPDEEFGERVAALVQLDGSEQLSEDKILEILKYRLSSFKVPKILELRAELPRDEAGKIRKRQLRDEFWVATGRAI